MSWPTEISCKHLVNGLLQARNSFPTLSIDGRCLGLECKHANAIADTDTISLTSDRLLGGGKRWSNISVSSRLCVDNDDRDDNSSFGCLPINVSSATTPKL